MQLSLPMLCLIVGLLISGLLGSYFLLWHLVWFMYRVYFALDKLQAIALMFHKMAFQLSRKLVTLHLENSTTKAYLCNQGVTESLFLSRVACHILNMAVKHGITLL